MDTKKVKEEKKMAIPFLPFELIVEIMLRLPVKSLLRFRSVSKQWNSIILDTHFAKSHFDLTTTTRNTGNKLLYIQFFLGEAEWVDIDASIRRNCANVKLPFNGQSLVKERGSCRGFILLELRSHLIIWNPSTGTHKRIPFSPLALDVLDNYSDKYSFMRRCNAWFGLGYDSSTDDYLVMVGWNDYKDKIKANMEFFSVRSNSWKQVSQDFRLIQNPKETLNSDGAISEFPYMVKNYSQAAIFCNGALHWLLYKKPPSVNVNVIVAFNLASKSFFEIPLPKGRLGYSLILYGEFLGVFVPIKSPNYEICIMKEYRVQSSWTISHVVRPYDDSDYGETFINEKGQFVWVNDGIEHIMKLNIVDQVVKVMNNPLDISIKMCLFTESILSLPQ